VLVASTTPGSFTISYANVPQAVCINAVSAGGSWTGITVGNALALPVTPAAAQAACSGATNTIVWTSN
jgi:hypothetical protein